MGNEDLPLKIKYRGVPIKDLANLLTITTDGVKSLGEAIIRLESRIAVCEDGLIRLGVCKRVNVDKEDFELDFDIDFDLDEEDSLLFEENDELL